ncbi:MAG: hypothetical protein L7T26_03890 [Pseudomonadales bacterium]|jgi:hypothetical protein|nr:hypothetical protein [Pseudomonadales bacterium]
MLRASAQATDTHIDLDALLGNESAANLGIPHGQALLAFAEAFMSGDQHLLASARHSLLEASSPELVVEAAGVAANFQRMVRIADATGIPVDDMSAPGGIAIREALGLAAFASAQHSLQPSH